MYSKTIIAGAAAVFLGMGAAEAAPIDLAALGFTEGAPSYSGSGGVFYDQAIQLLTDDFLNMISIDGFAGSELQFFFDPFGPNISNVFYEPSGDFESFDIVASGETETGSGDTLEFLLSRYDSDLGNGTVGVGLNAILRITSQDFDFSTRAPFDFFDDNSTDPGNGFLEYFTDVNVTLTALDRTTPVIPLPASLPLILAGLGSFALVRRRRKA